VTLGLHGREAGAARGARSLRPGQREALEQFAGALRAGSSTELVVVPVGYGKTVIGAGSFDVASGIAGADTCLYVAPTDVLRTQVYDGVDKAMALVGSSRSVRKIIAENANMDRLGATAANFVVASYQQIAAAPAKYARFCRSRRVHLVCDEAHHLGERGQWASALAGLPVVSALLLSATPVRLDGDPLAGVRYVYDAEADGQVVDPLVHVTMRQAWKERRILKRLTTQMKDYAVELRGADGELYSFTASEMAELPDFDQRCVRQQLCWNEDYVQPLVREFAATLLQKIASAPGKHQGLVFAATTGHADHLYRLFAQWHPSLRCAVVHSGEGVSDAESQARLRDFHLGRYEVLIQVRKASEGFDAPAVSVILKLDAVFSREPVIQQFGRGLRYNHSLTEAENVLHVFVGRDPRLGALIGHLERESLAAIRKPGDEVPGDALTSEQLDGPEAPEGNDATVEILDVEEAGDAYLDETGRLVEGQQLTMFGVTAPAPRPAAGQRETATVEVVDLAGDLRSAVEYCRTWTNRAARARGRLGPPGENAHAWLNMAYSRETGVRGTLSTAEAYRRKGDWMKRRYAEFIG